METRLLILDTETSGLDPDVHSLLSVGLVAWARTGIVAELEVHVAEADIVTDPESMAINQIDLSEHRRRSTSAQDAVARIESFVEAHFPAVAPEQRVVIAGHNVGFDVAFLRRLFSQAERPFRRLFSHRLVDTASVIQFLSIAGLLPLANAGSDQAFKYFGIGFRDGERHTAIADAHATAQLLDGLLAAVTAPVTRSG